MSAKTSKTRSPVHVEHISHPDQAQARHSTRHCHMLIAIYLPPRTCVAAKPQPGNPTISTDPRKFSRTNAMVFRDPHYILNICLQGTVRFKVPGT